MRVLPPTVLLALLGVTLTAQPAMAGRPRPACKILQGKIAEVYAEVYAEVSPTPIFEGPRGCAYANAQGQSAGAVSLYITGPLPRAVAKATYEAAFDAARQQGTPENLTGFGPHRAFATENADGETATATVTFLAGRWIGQLAITAPAAAGDVAFLLKHHVWKRWAR